MPTTDVLLAVTQVRHPRIKNMKNYSKSNARKKAERLFKAAVTQYIVAKGARPGRSYQYELDTPAGILHFVIYDDWIACRFDDLEQGCRFGRFIGRPCNPHNGKWNFCFYDGTIESLDSEDMLRFFGFYLDALLHWEPPTDVSK